MTCLPCAHDRRLAERHRVVALGHVALGGAVDALGLEEEHRIGIADRGEEQALRVVRVARAHDLEARDVDEERLGRLRVVEPAADAAADGRAHTILAGYSPPERQRIFASSLTIWSYAGKMKSANWISGTGTRP